jgi:hypothetical protein
MWTEKKNDINSQIKWYMYREDKKTQIVTKICMRPSNGKEKKKRRKRVSVEEQLEDGSVARDRPARAHM